MKSPTEIREARITILHQLLGTVEYLLSTDHLDAFAKKKLGAYIEKIEYGDYRDVTNAT